MSKPTREEVKATIELTSRLWDSKGCVVIDLEEATDSIFRLFEDKPEIPDQKWKTEVMHPDTIEAGLNKLTQEGWHVWPQLIQVLPTLSTSGHTVRSDSDFVQIAHHVQADIIVIVSKEMGEEWTVL